MSLSQRQRLAAIATGSAGNLIEWFDFYVYAFTALYFAASFFPEGDRTAQLLNVAGIYAVGFLIRPVGGWFFGRLANTVGLDIAVASNVMLAAMLGFMLLQPAMGALSDQRPVQSRAVSVARSRARCRPGAQHFDRSLRRHCRVRRVIVQIRGARVQLLLVRRRHLWCRVRHGSIHA